MAAIESHPLQSTSENEVAVVQVASVWALDLVNPGRHLRAL